MPLGRVDTRFSLRLLRNLLLGLRAECFQHRLGRLSLLRFAMLKRVRYWTMVPGWLMVFALFWLRKRLRRPQTEGVRKSDT